MSEKWWDMLDDELDDLFREASDKAEIPFDSSALDKLKQKIDYKSLPQLEPTQGLKKRWVALAGLLIFFGMAFLYTFSKIVGEKVPTTSRKVVGEKIPTTARKKAVDEKTLTMAKTSEVVGEKIPTTARKKAVDEKTLTMAKTSEVVDEKTLTMAKTSEVFGEKTPTMAKTSMIKGYVAKKNKDKLVREEEAQYDFSVKKTVPNIEESNGILNDASILSFSEKTQKKSKLAKLKFNDSQVYDSSVHQEVDAPISMSLVIPENKIREEEIVPKNNFYNADFLGNKETKPLSINIVSELPTFVDAPPIVMKQPKFSRFGVRFAIAPEINSIERMETSAVVGSMFALLLEYRLTKKLTLQTGVNYSKKKYTGNFEYYRAWPNASPKPVNVDGICNVVDIPINLRLNAFEIKKNTFFISGGISSYLMSDEIYTYNYAYGPPRVRDWTGSSSNFYWSTLNLSVGIERKMNKHFTLQIEPFLKTPLTGVGRGMVNLYSSGLLFSTKYEF